MGTCTPSLEDCSSSINNNYLLTKVNLGTYCNVSIIQGSTTQHYSETLLCLTTLKTIKQNPDCLQYIDNLYSLGRIEKKVIKMRPNKQCPYRNLCVVVLEEYSSEIAEEYQEEFINNIREVFHSYTDITLYIGSTNKDTNEVPTQTLLAYLFHYVSSYLSRPLTLSLISQQKKCLNMIKYEIMKTEKWNGNLDWNWEIRY